MSRFSTRFVALALAACGHDTPPAPMAVSNPTRDVIATHLSIDLATNTGTATITFASSDTDGANLEIGDLVIGDVSVDTAEAAHELDLALPASSDPIDVTIDYTFMFHERFTGESKTGYTLIWPYFCGNLFPCHSDPADGTTFELALVDPSAVAVYPTTISAPAPAYQIAWTVGAYTEMPVGTTSSGTAISVFHLPGQDAAAIAGTKDLVAAFDWLETTLGPYTFGPKYASVAVDWPAGQIGGMEHHPYSHIASSAIGDEETNVHEAAHGWFGDGIRIACWEDFVLSEGTVCYLAARALDVVAPSVGAATWAGYAKELAALSGTLPVWPQSCGQVDILGDDLFSNAPYMRGAYFYKGIADKVGADKLDLALGTFYKQHAGGDAHMQDMLDTIKSVTGYDPTACAQTWLLDLSSATPPTPAPCP
jgi:aminopeptidase N